MALPKLIVVLGTTACGKSGLGVELAKHFGGEIVSADSRQVYRGLDLGTGKVTEEEFNRQRLMRSVEKALSGQWESPPPRPRYDCLLLGVTFPRDVVCRRIDERLQARLDAGMVEEVAALRAGGADDSFLEGLGLEYRYILWYLTGKIPTLDALKDELGRAIKRFAKRQMVWFQKDRDVLWLDMEGDFLTQAVRAVEDFLA